MSVIKFELTEQHVALARNLNWANLFDNEDNELGPFGYPEELYEDMGLILYGKPKGKFDPTSVDEIEYSDEQKAEMDKLLEELPQALQIMLQTGIFELGNYKTKFHDINWKKKK